MYDDRRRLSGDPIEGIAGLRAACERILEQYPRVEWRTLAVRGERLALTLDSLVGRRRERGDVSSRLYEFGDDRRLDYHGRFDEDDFDGAYRELERRYYAGEGAAFATNGQALIGFVDALDQLDVEAAHRFSWPDCRLAYPSVDADATGDAPSMSSIGWMEERAGLLFCGQELGIRSSVGCRRRA